MLPDTVGSYELDKWSIVLTDYMESASSADKTLYQKWLEQLGLTSGDVNMAVAMDATTDQKITVLGLRAKGADPAKVDAAFQEALKAAGWQFAHRQIGNRVITEATDPSNGSVGDVYASKGIVFIIISEDPALATGALVALP